MPERAALMLDGGFVKKKLQNRSKQLPSASDIVSLCADILASPRLKDLNLLRIYYYDCPPIEGKAVHPLTREEVEFSRTRQASQNKALLDSLELEPDFAVRRGMLLQTGWKLGKTALRSLRTRGDGKLGARKIEARDIVPDISQKGVDMRIGLDIATLALKRTVDVLVLVTGDSDFVPAMKLARKEGLRVYLECLGHPVLRELKAHADFVLQSGKA
jgi:uncharacterized LabA/DUF88 family protein